MPGRIKKHHTSNCQQSADRATSDCRRARSAAADWPAQKSV